MTKRSTKRTCKTTENRASRDRSILLLRYHTVSPVSNSKVYGSYIEIGQLLRLSSQRIRQICLNAFKKNS